MSFEDVRLVDFDVKDFQNAYDIWLELKPRSEEKHYFFYDEIQLVEGWERWIAQLEKNHNNIIFVTGSNSNLLSTEFSSLLTGRHQQLELYPMSLFEIPETEVIRDAKGSQEFDREQKIKLKPILFDYFSGGGFPRAVLDRRTAILPQYFRDIILRDIVLRRKFKHEKKLLQLGRILMSENTKILNKSRLAEAIGVNDLSTLNDYLHAFEQAYLVFEIKKFDYSIQKQTRSHSKFYAVDTGLARHSGFVFSDNFGRALENLVFLTLKRRGYEVFYWHSSDDYEVDFVCRTEDGRLSAIQVCVDSSDEEVFNREIRALFAAKEELKIEDLQLIYLDGYGEASGIQSFSFFDWEVSSPKLSDFA